MCKTTEISHSGCRHIIEDLIKCKTARSRRNQRCDHKPRISRFIQRGDCVRCRERAIHNALRALALLWWKFLDWKGDLKRGLGIKRGGCWSCDLLSSDSGNVQTCGFGSLSAVRLFWGLLACFIPHNSLKDSRVDLLEPELWEQFLVLWCMVLILEYFILKHSLKCY